MIKPNNQIVLLASEAEDIDAAYDSMEGQQDFVSIGGVEIPVGYDRSENTFYLLDDGEASRDALEKAKKLLKKFGGGQLKSTQNTKDNLAGKDYVAFADGNTYQVNTYTESVKTFESKRKVSESKKSETREDGERDVDDYDTMRDGLRDLGFELDSDYRHGKIYPYRRVSRATKDGVTYSFMIESEGEYTKDIVVYGGKFDRNERGTKFNNVTELLNAMKSVSESKKSEATENDVEKAFMDAAKSKGVADRTTVSTNGDTTKCTLKMKIKVLNKYIWSYNAKTNELDWCGDESMSDRGAHKKFKNLDDMKSWVAKDITALLELENDAKELGYSESKTSESKKNESAETIKMGIDYTMFMRMCESAAFLDKDEDYWDALWEYYSGIGEIDDALVFFDNLFQYTSWKDVEETYDELPDEAKDDSKDKEEVIDEYLDENGEIRGNTVTKYGDHYLWVY